MSWNARRYIPGKPVIRAIRHRKKILSQAESAALAHQPPTEREIDDALTYATAHRLDRLAAIIMLANQITVYERYNKHAGPEIERLENECESWKFKWLLERSKVKNLEAVVSSLRRSRQQARTRISPSIAGFKRRSRLMSSA
jgi:hypothetical protein